MVHERFLKLYSDNNWPDRIMHSIINSLYDTFSDISHANTDNRKKTLQFAVAPTTAEITEYRTYFGWVTWYLSFYFTLSDNVSCFHLNFTI